MSMAIASDADETSTGSNRNPVENEDTNMLADSSGLNQPDCTVHHFYEKLKDFAFDMPGGWTDPTISLFIDTFKLYKDDFSRSHPDDLKIWQKIVKRCVERSNNHKVFTVNSVMELAGSLKSHVLRNECRKDDETFKVLYNDVVDIIPYFPNTTCDSVSQNLRLRSRTTVHKITMQDAESTTEIKAFSSTNDASPTRSTNIDNLIIKYCEEMNLRSERYCSNMNWTKIGKKILENHGLRIDIKKHLGNMKRKLDKDLMGEVDPDKRKSLFLETVGPYKPFFDLMPPRTIKTEQFIKEGTSTPGSAEISSDELADTCVSTRHDETSAPDQKINRKARPKTVRAMDSFPKIKKILASEEHQDSSESDEPVRRPRISPKKQSTYYAPSDDASSESVTSPEHVDPLGAEQRNARTIINRKQPPPKKRIVTASLPESIPKAVGTRRVIPRSDDDSSSPSRTGPLKRPLPDSIEPSSSAKNNLSFRSQNFKKTKIISADQPTVHINKNQSIIMNPQAKVELASLKVLGTVMTSIDKTANGAKTMESAKIFEVPSERKSAKGNFDSLNSDFGNSVSGDSVDNSINSADVDSHPEGKTSAGCSSSGLEKVKSNIVTPINVKVSDQIYPEASTTSNTLSSSEPPSFVRSDNVIQPLPNNSTVVQDFNRLERMDDDAVRIVEGYKEKMKESGHTVMQLLPKQHSLMVQPVTLSNTSNSDSDYNFQTTLSLSKPPGWFDAFLSDYKKHEMWKMHQLLKMQQELVDMENRKLNVLEKILSSLNDRRS